MVCARENSSGVGAYLAYITPKGLLLTKPVEDMYTG